MASAPDDVYSVSGLDSDSMREVVAPSLGFDFTGEVAGGLSELFVAPREKVMVKPGWTPMATAQWGPWVYRQPIWTTGTRMVR